MPQLRLDPTYLHGDIIDRLVATTGHPKPFVVGALALFLHGTRERHLETATAMELVGFLMVPLPEVEGWMRALMAAGVLDFGPTPDQYRIVANAGIRERFLARQAVMRRAAATSLVSRGLTSRKATEPTPPLAVAPVAAPKPKPRRVAKVPPDKTPLQDLSGRAWDSYSARYQQVVGVMPIRNAKTNAQVKNLAQRLGEDVVGVLQFFVGHPDPYFTRRQWSLDAIMREAESMHTQWRKQQPITPGIVKAQSQVTDFAQRQQEIAARYRQT